MSSFRAIGLLGLVLPLVAACAVQPEHAGDGYGPADHVLSLHADDHRHEADELLALDLAGGHEEVHADLGLVEDERHELTNLGLTLHHLRITDGRHPFDVRDEHRERLPDLAVDVHHHFDHHAAKARPRDYTAKVAARWQGRAASCGAGLRIGIIDSPVRTRHAAFKGARITAKSFIRKGRKPGSSRHGTAVTGVLAGQGDWGGLLPGAEYFTANVFYRRAGSKDRGSSAAMVKALDWLVGEKVDVINISIGGAPNVLVERALIKTAEAGIIVVASAGNAGPSAKKRSYPAAYKPVIATAAVTDKDLAAKFSSAGDYVEFAAPGVNIWTPVNIGGKAMSGTSFAAPILAGLAAVHGRRTVPGDPAKLRQSFKEKAGGAEWNKYTGWGVVRFPAAC